MKCTGRPAWSGDPSSPSIMLSISSRLAMRISLACPFLLGSSLAACGDDATPPPRASDGGNDGGALRPDAGPPPGPVCEGTPVSCAVYPLDSCESHAGCARSRCRGFPIACERLTMDQCVENLGCAWAGSACTGEPVLCSGLSNEQCPSQVGCVIGGSDRCAGPAISCSSLAADECAMQAGCSIARCARGAGIASFDVRVVAGPFTPLVPLEGARIRAETPCDEHAVEVTTDASGVAHLELDRALGRWDLTAVKPGYSATSILAVSEIELTGDIRLDPIPAPITHRMVPFIGMPGSGEHRMTLSGYGMPIYSATPGDVGAVDFEWIAGAEDVPLRLVLVERSGTEVVNAAYVDEVRIDADFRGMNIDFSAPPASEDSTMTIRLDGTTAAGAVTVDQIVVMQTAPLVDRWSAQVGGGTSSVEGATVNVVLRSFPSVLPADYASVAISTPSARIEVHARDLEEHVVVEVGGGELTANDGTSLGTLLVQPVDPSFHDAVELHFTSTTDEGTRWRVFAPTIPREIYVPHLPEGMSSADLEAGADVVLGFARFVRARPGMRPWSTQNRLSGDPDIDYLVTHLAGVSSIADR
jgi:hypothetical protein